MLVFDPLTGLPVEKRTNRVNPLSADQTIREPANFRGEKPLPLPSLIDNQSSRKRSLVLKSFTTSHCAFIYNNPGTLNRPFSAIQAVDAADNKFGLRIIRADFSSAYQYPLGTPILSGNANYLIGGLAISRKAPTNSSPRQSFPGDIFYKWENFNYNELDIIFTCRFSVVDFANRILGLEGSVEGDIIIPQGYYVYFYQCMVVAPAINAPENQAGSLLYEQFQSSE